MLEREENLKYFHGFFQSGLLTNFDSDRKKFEIGLVIFDDEHYGEGPVFKKVLPLAGLIVSILE